MTTYRKLNHWKGDRTWLASCMFPCGDLILVLWLARNQREDFQAFWTVLLMVVGMQSLYLLLSATGHFRRSSDVTSRGKYGSWVPFHPLESVPEQSYDCEHWTTTAVFGKHILSKQLFQRLFSTTYTLLLVLSPTSPSLVSIDLLILRNIRLRKDRNPRLRILHEKPLR